ncbi:hypothetical protein C8Q76DRAFT_704561 [Earliella scabrosa]|nr:hypothetical protein C8Q76DRAFT_704561 [Earliella scabrosa]
MSPSSPSNSSALESPPYLTTQMYPPRAPSTGQPRRPQVTSTPAEARNLTTPQPSPASELSFQVGEYVVLLYAVDDRFPGNEVVEIDEHVHQQRSPSAPVEWTRKDIDTVYRFHKRCPEHSDDILTSHTSTHKAPLHTQLAPTRNGRPSPEPYDVRSTVYTLVDLKFLRRGGGEMNIPAGTKCRIIKYTTRMGDISEQPSGGSRRNATASFRYVLEVKYRTWRWMENGLRCRAMKECHNFRKATPSEIAAYKNQKLPAPGFVL